MSYSLYQRVAIVDMNNEIISEELFKHGQFDDPPPAIGATVVSHQLGLSKFDVVYDTREGKIMKSKIVDVELDLMKSPVEVHVYLEPITLIVGQHDIGVA